MEVGIYNLKGELVHQVQNDVMLKGNRILPLSTKNAAGNPIAAGIYILRVDSDTDSQSIKIVKMK